MPILPLTIDDYLFTVNRLPATGHCLLSCAVHIPEQNAALQDQTPYRPRRPRILRIRIAYIRKKVDKRQTLSYHHSMKYFNWSTEKNETLKRERGLSFEEIAYLIEAGQILSVEENPARTDQKIYILEIDNYAVVVPFVETEKEIFLKTAFPSRKYSKRFGLKEEI
jgi:uncharacterized DUF497 family protein